MFWKAVSSTALLIACSACAAPLPERDPSMAWIDVHSGAGHRLSAQRMDGAKVNDARFFQIDPGAHQLRMRLTYDRGGNRAGGNERRCLVNVDYSDFTAGQRYSVRALAKGWTVRVWLYSSDGQRLIESKSVRCGSQY